MEWGLFHPIMYVFWNGPSLNDQRYTIKRISSWLHVPLWLQKYSMKFLSFRFFAINWLVLIWFFSVLVYLPHWNSILKSGSFKIISISFDRLNPDFRTEFLIAFCLLCFLSLQGLRGRPNVWRRYREWSSSNQMPAGVYTSLKSLRTTTRWVLFFLSCVRRVVALRDLRWLCMLCICTQYVCVW